jgi:hypothetical protein
MTTAPHIYIDTDVPVGLTLVEWRRSQTTTKRRRHPFRLANVRHRLAH